METLIPLFFIYYCSSPHKDNNEFLYHQGEHIVTYRCRSKPVRLAVIDILAVAVTTYEGVMILCVGADYIKLRDFIPANGKQYKAVAAINCNTLALGFWKTPGIEIMEIATRRIIRHLEGVGCPINIVAAPDGSLVCSNFKDNIVKIRSDTGEVVLSIASLLSLNN
ncbi:hypothetical protein PoB_000903600 [Plakobranchus ocellatus]|uniref:Uncharacterized protein n=1 Tax=Plakobranchus ocellatus TaxID=259542 RepID=A0AAV3YH77_9GAST|nr:hypothetical protein PoB_000903600 [Plakobranchus ocellatus]